jgi:hypothetical protein
MLTLAGALSGCGRQGVLEQPAPLFGAQAKEDYAARRAAEAASNGGVATPKTPVADQPDPNADNAPLTRRDLRAPQELNTPISKDPIEGVPNPNPPTPSLQPPDGA